MIVKMIVDIRAMNLDLEFSVRKLVNKNKFVKFVGFYSLFYIKKKNVGFFSRLENFGIFLSRVVIWRVEHVYILVTKLTHLFLFFLHLFQMCFNLRKLITFEIKFRNITKQLCSCLVILLNFIPNHNRCMVDCN